MHPFPTNLQVVNLNEMNSLQCSAGYVCCRFREMDSSAQCREISEGRELRDGAVTYVPASHVCGAVQ